jgi:preprotein translocase subunit SecG
MYYALVGLYVLVCFLLLVVVLLQQGKGGDIAAAFGGSSSQTAFGARAGATFLTRATAVLGTLFMLGAFALGVVGRGGSSVVGGVEGPTTLPTSNAPLASPPAVSSTPTPSGSPAASPTPTTPAPAAGAKPTPTATKTPPPPAPGK